MKTDAKWCDTVWEWPKFTPIAGRAAVLTPAQSHLQSSRHTVTSLIYNQKYHPSTEGFKYPPATI